MAGTILQGDFGFLPGIFQETNPTELPVTTLLAARGYVGHPQKTYTYTYHANDNYLAVTPTLASELSSPNFGSSGFTSGSNCMQVWDEGAAESFWRMGEQNLARTLGWQESSNVSREENPMARAMLEAVRRIKIQAEYVGREGKYNNPNDGGSGTYKQRGYRYAPGIVNKAIGVAGGSAVGSLATLTLVKLIDTMQTLWENKVNGSDNLTMFTNAIGKRQLSDIFRDQYNGGKNGLDVNKFGVNVQSFLTDFGAVEVVLTHNMPVDQVYILNLSAMNMVSHSIPGKGFMFERDIPLKEAGVAKSVYAEMGVDHGPGNNHARLYGIGSTAGHITAGTIESV